MIVDFITVLNILSQERIKQIFNISFVLCLCALPDFNWHLFYNPPSKICPGGTEAQHGYSIAGRIFEGGFERKFPKNVHTGSENSESQKK